MHMILYEINLAQVSLLYYIKVFKFDRFYQFKYKLTQPRLIVNLSPSDLTISVKEDYIYIFNQILRFLSFLSIMMLDQVLVLTILVMYMCLLHHSFIINTT